MLTLVVPVFNKEQYLSRCMDALLAQTVKDYEILLIDDGSTDGSGALCDCYAAAQPERIRCIHKLNGGLFAARNTGIEAARGEWITFPDPDDWVEPEYVQTFLELCSRYPSDLVCTGFWVDDGEKRSSGYADGPTVIMTAREGRRALLLPPRMGGFSWNKCYRVELLRRHGLRFRPDVGVAEDMDFAYRYLLHCGDICFCPSQRTCHYDQHPESVTHQGFSSRNLEDFRAYEGMLNDTDPVIVTAARDEMCVTAVNHLWSLLCCRGWDRNARRILLRYLRQHLWIHLRSTRYTGSRKLQALTAAISPQLFVILKRAVRGYSH